MRPVLRPIAGLVLLATACGRGDTGSSDVIRSDSAGVLLISSGARDTVLPWTFEEVDVLRDSLGEPYLFTRLYKFNVLTDRAGRIYVLTRDPAVVRFGREGREERTLGRRGGGPGEFQVPIAIGAKGDTVWVLDVAKGGLVRFMPDLTPAPDQRLDGALADAELLSFRTGGVWFRRTTRTDTTVVAEVLADTAGGAPLVRSVTPTGGPVNFGCIGIPQATPLYSPQVSLQASVARLLVNAQPGYDLRLFEGPRLIASIRRPLVPRPVTTEDVLLQYPNGMSIGVPGRPPCVVSVEELMARQGVARTMPFVFDVMLLSDGTMWALRVPPGAPPVVDVFGPDGLYAGTMRGRGLPLALLPNGELLFAREDEETGGQHLVRTRVRR